MHRRRLLRHVLAAMASGGVGWLSRTGLTVARQSSVVVVQQDAGVVGIDPWTGEVVSVSRLAMPVGQPIDHPTPLPSQLPATLRTIDTEREIDYWMRSVDGSAFIYRRTGDESSGWWCLDEAPRYLSDLPPDLEPGLPSGSTGRWLHGAVIDPEHLGAGSLRLIAVDTATGAVVLDEIRDRRLELAATTTSDDGNVLAHVQGGNTRIDVWGAILASGDTVAVTVPIDPPAMVAPGAIQLDAASDEGGVIAAGLTWSSPAHPEPIVITISWTPGEDPTITTVAGELVGIAPATV